MAHTHSKITVGKKYKGEKEREQGKQKLSPMDGQEEVQ